MAKVFNIYKLADFYQIFSDATRLEILISLEKGEKNVSDLVNELKLTKSAISHQLKILKDNNLVKFQKSGKYCFYSLSDDHIKELLDVAITHLMEE